MRIYNHAEQTAKIEQLMIENIKLKKENAFLQKENRQLQASYNNQFLHINTLVEQKKALAECLKNHYETLY